MLACLLDSDEPVESFKEAMLPSAKKAIEVYGLLTKEFQSSAEIQKQYCAKYGKISVNYVQVIFNELYQAGAPIKKIFKPGGKLRSKGIYVWALK